MNGAIPDPPGGGLIARVRALAMGRGLARNSLLSVAQALVQLVALLGTYRILIAWQGIEGLGIWSFLMIFVAVAALIDLSGAVGLSRLAAGFGHIFPGRSRAEVIETILLTSLGINCVLGSIVLLAGPAAISANIEPAELAKALSMVPWMAGIVVATALSVGISMALDGVMRADLRAIISAAATVLNLAVAAVAIPSMGLPGFALAQLTQLGAIILAGWVFLRKEVPELNVVPLRWRYSVAAGAWNYALKINAQNFFQQVTDPVVRFAINAFGGTASLGLYELASKISLQLRGLALAAATPLIPVIAGRRDMTPETGATLVRAHRASAGVSVLLVLAALAAVPVLSLMMLGHVSSDLVALNSLLVVGWATNVSAIPLYIAAQATGNLRWNLVAGILTLTTISVIAFALGHRYGAFTAVAGLAAGLVIGAASIIVGNGRRFLDPGQARQVQQYALAALGICSVLAAAAWIVFDQLQAAA